MKFLNLKCKVENYNALNLEIKSLKCVGIKFYNFKINFEITKF